MIQTTESSEFKLNLHWDLNDYDDEMRKINRFEEISSSRILFTEKDSVSESPNFRLHRVLAQHKYHIEIISWIYCFILTWTSYIDFHIDHCWNQLFFWAYFDVDLSSRRKLVSKNRYHLIDFWGKYRLCVRDCA